MRIPEFAHSNDAFTPEPIQRYCVCAQTRPGANTPEFALKCLDKHTRPLPAHSAVNTQMSYLKCVTFL